MEDTPETTLNSVEPASETLQRDPVKTVILASMIGTAIEFFLIFMHMELQPLHIFPTSFSLN